MDELSFKYAIIERLTKIEERLDIYNKQLELHMRRTALLEEQLDKRISPVEGHIKEVNGVLKFFKVVVWIAAAIGTIATALKVF